MQVVVQDGIPIKTLIDQGIDAEDVKKLEDVGIYTCNRLIHLTKKYLTGVIGLSEANVDKIWEAAERKMEHASAQTGGSSEPKILIARIIAQVTSVKKDMLALTLGVQSDSELEFVGKAISNLATSASQFLACRKATFAGDE